VLTFSDDDNVVAPASNRPLKQIADVFTSMELTSMS
jgi:hypothetical protein